MKCASCGTEIPNGVKFCPACGASQPEAPTAPPVAPPVQPQYSYQAPPAPAAYAAPVQAKVKTTGQIVFSIINILCCGLATIFGVIALIFAIMAGSAPTYEEGLKKVKTAKTLNIVGIILGVLGVIVTIAAGLILFIMAAVSGNFNWDYSGY